MTAGGEGRVFRPLIGLLCVVGSLIGFAGLYFIEIPTGNRDAMMLALGIIFGWGSAVVQSEYGSTATGRKVADSAIRNIERQNAAPAPADAQAAAEQVAGAAGAEADKIRDAS